jgi:hypothetical protein
MDAGSYLSDAKGFMGGLKRAAAEGGKGAVDEMIRGVMSGDRGPMDLAMNIAEGGGFGFAGQAAIGELAPYAFKYGWLGEGGKERVGELLFNTGPTREGLTPEAMAAQYDNIKRGNLTLMEGLDTPDGSEDAIALADRVADTLARATFTSRKNVDRPEDFERYASTIGFVRDAVRDADDRLRTTMTTYLGDHKSGFKRHQQTRRDLQEAANTYDSLGKNAKGKLGSLTVPYTSTVQRGVGGST